MNVMKNLMTHCSGYASLVRMLCIVRNAYQNNSDDHAYVMGVECPFVNHAETISMNVVEEVAWSSMDGHNIIVQVARKMYLKSACRAKRESVRFVLTWDWEHICPIHVLDAIEKCVKDVMMTWMWMNL